MGIAVKELSSWLSALAVFFFFFFFFLLLLLFYAVSIVCVHFLFGF